MRRVEILIIMILLIYLLYSWISPISLIKRIKEAGQNFDNTTYREDIPQYFVSAEKKHFFFFRLCGIKKGIIYELTIIDDVTGNGNIRNYDWNKLYIIKKNNEWYIEKLVLTP